MGGFMLLTALLASVWLVGLARADQLQEPNQISSGIYSWKQSDDGVFPPSDQACRLCHGESDEVITFPSGEQLPVTVDLEAIAQSVHGGEASSLFCTDCHRLSEYLYPHEPIEQGDLRSYEIARSDNCEQCHQQPHLTSHPGKDSETPVVCTDCHQSHNVRPVGEWHGGTGTETCVNCHTELGASITDPLQLTQIIRDGMFARRVDIDYCLSCHKQPGLTVTFANGDVLSATIDPAALHDSVHGVDNSWQALDCTDCHGRYTYPHDRPPASGEREYNLQRYELCARCHERHYERTLDSVHGAALEAGNEDAAVCTDCHGAHDTPPPDEPRERISHTCEQCHSTIFQAYSHSVHGEALLVDSNPDVPVCIDCHGVHDIQDPTTDLARIRSPELCAQCHADEELMSKYDISTDVFDTYVSDFHGTTIELFDPEDPDAAINKAVCYDCHGVHDIRPVDDPQSGIKLNLVETCRQCHPNANDNFPDAWTSHYRPSLQHNPLVFLVDQFYTLIIPGTLLFLGFLVVTDIFRKVRMRIRNRPGE